MAIGDRKLEYEITADVKGFRRGIDTASKQLNGFGRELRGSLSTIGGRQFDSIITGFKAIGIAASAAAIGGIYLFSRALRGSIELANVQEQAEAKLGAVLRATGEAAGFTKDELIKYAGSLQDLTGKGDEAIISGMAVLATFKNIKGEAFQGATKAALDLSAVLGQDLQSSMTQLGKALDDPLQGLSALRRSGVSFTKQQQEQIKTLAESGKLLQAQKIILAEIAAQYGGAAEALRGTYQGAREAAKGAFNDLREELGAIVTRNAFFIEMNNELEQVFKRLGLAIKENRAAMHDLAKNGVLNLVTAMGYALETVRFMYNGWKGLGIVLHGVITIGIKGMEAWIFTIRKLLYPLDLLLTGLAKAGAIDINPLKGWQDTLKGFGDFSMAELDKLLGEVEKTNAGFDRGKQAIEDFRTKLSGMSAEYISPADGLAEKTKKETTSAIQEVRKIGGVYTNVYADATSNSGAATEKIKGDVQSVGREVEKVGGHWGKGYAQATTTNQQFIEQAKKNLATLQQEYAKGNTTIEQAAKINKLQVMLDNAAKASAQTAIKINKDTAAIGDNIANIGGVWINAYNEAAVAENEFITQAKANLAAMEAEAAKGGATPEQLAKIEALKNKLEEIAPKSKKATEEIKKDTEKTGDNVEKVGEVWTNVFSIAAQDSDKVTKKMLADIAKIKKEAATIKYGTGTTATQGFARGGAIKPFFGGLKGYGGGDRRLVLVEDGEHVIRKEAVARLGHSFFQRFNRLQFPSLPKFATGGPIGPQTAMAMAGASPTYNVTLNVSGGSANPQSIERAVLRGLERAHNRRSA